MVDPVVAVLVNVKGRTWYIAAEELPDHAIPGTRFALCRHRHAKPEKAIECGHRTLGMAQVIINEARKGRLTP